MMLRVALLLLVAAIVVSCATTTPQKVEKVASQAPADSGYVSVGGHMDVGCKVYTKAADGTFHYVGTIKGFFSSDGGMYQDRVLLEYPGGNVEEKDRKSFLYWAWMKADDPNRFGAP